MRRPLNLVLTAALIILVALPTVGLVTGKVAYVVTHGVSMQPTYHQDDLVVVARDDAYKVGDIAAYRDEVRDINVLHRIIGGDGTGFVLQGDNNTSIDTMKPTEDEIIGKAVLHVPQGGVWMGRLKSPPGLAVIILAIVFGGGRKHLPQKARQKGRRRRRSTAPSGRRAAPERSRTAEPAQVDGTGSGKPPWQRAAVCAAAALAVLSAVLGIAAWAGPAEVVAGASGQRSAGKMTFDYSAGVRRSPAYDGTEVRAPDPVFRKLIGKVDVRFDYTGEPGAVAVDADLSTMSGWHSTVPLAEEKRFTGDGYRGSVTLDLAALEKRATDAADVIDIPAGNLAITVRTRVTTARGVKFAPALRLTLDPARLVLADGAKALVFEDTTAVAGGTRSVPRMVELFGHPVLAAGTARKLAVVLGFGALLAGAWLVLNPRRTVPGDADEQARLRYEELIVEVEAAAPVPGRPVVEVAGLDRLGRLAEGYGLMILHSSDGTREVFSVHDQAATYHYRTPDRSTGRPPTTGTRSESGSPVGSETTKPEDVSTEA